jgi:hypothetical protein
MSLRVIIVLLTYLLSSKLLIAQEHHMNMHMGKDTSKAVTPAKAKQKVPISKTPSKRTPVDSITGVNHPIDSMNMQMPMPHVQPDTTPSKNMHAGMHMGNDKGMDSMTKEHMDMEHGGMEMNTMSDPFSLHLPMKRHGSGTGWLPDNAPMNAYMLHSKSWMFMFHGNLFLRYTAQDVGSKGFRGDRKADAPNWFMAMGQRRVGSNGLFHFSTMISLDPITEGPGGYPLLFQSGESYQGKPIIDHQHPHDLFSELSVSYSQALSKDADVFVYLGYPGEPALGPVAFMHRPSAIDNPDAPLSHHWSDATHITFGVATLGIRLGSLKADGSLFTGREPDEYRYGFDKPRFDSWSGRISYNPTRSWSMQLSHGFIKSPEALHPGEDIQRTTASAIYSASSTNNHQFNASIVWGMNKSAGISPQHSVLLEGSWNMNKCTLYGRYEYVQKSAEELFLDNNVFHDDVFPIHAITIGAAYKLVSQYKTNLSIGAQSTVYIADKRLNVVYGNSPIGLEVYLRLCPQLMQ